MSSAGRLFVVATPIGNLGDLTPRAVEILRAVDLIAAEDTRVTRRLLAHAGVKARLVSYRDVNEAKLAPSLVRRLGDGESVALVSDAGTPGISDPGFRLVHAAVVAGIEVVAVPGPSALIALLSVSGLPSDRFSFEGFPPTGRKARAEMLAGLSGAGRTVVFYESPRRIVAFLREIVATLSDPDVAVGRELTKLHEEVLRGKASAVADLLAERGTRGEFVIGVYAEPRSESATMDAAGEIRALLVAGMSTRDIATHLKPRGISRRDVYSIVRSLRVAES